MRERSSSAGAEPSSQLCDLQSISVTPRAERRSVSSARDGRSPRSMLSEQERSDQRVGSANRRTTARVSDWRSRTGRIHTVAADRVVEKRRVTLTNQREAASCPNGRDVGCLFLPAEWPISDRGNVADGERSEFGRLRPRSIAVRLRSASNLPHFENARPHA